MTDTEKDELKQEILSAIKADSQSVDELESVTTLTNVNSLPAMKGIELVSVPISLLSKPATDAAALANAAAQSAKDKADLATEAAEAANNAVAEAETATQNATEAAQSAITAAETATEAAEGIGDKIRLSMEGQTARFDEILENSVTISDISSLETTKVVYIIPLKKFADAKADGTYFANFPNADMYMNTDRSEILKDKVYLCGDKAYVWSEEVQNLIEMSGSGSGSGSGFYNVTAEKPLIGGYYTKETAIAALSDAEIEDEDKRGMIITFEASTGKWVDYRFNGTSLLTFLDANAWERYGGGDAIKTLHVTKGVNTEDITPDSNGIANLDIPIVEVDQTIEDNSTNPVEGKAISAKFKELSGKYGAALQLNEVGEGNNKAYSLSLLDENGEVLNTSGQFTGGGGGNVSTTKITLTRLTANPTVKSGDTVKLSYKYDQTDTESGESTGNSGSAVILVSHGANSTTLESVIAAGSTQEIDVTDYLGVGSNTVRVRVTAGEGEEAQVSTISWTVTVVQLTLTSSFNIASVINRGDLVSIPYALSGRGTKTLRCYVNGEDKEDRTITASSANGSFSISTSEMAHGSHTVQMVCELELAGGDIIKSNSIFYSIGVREDGHNTPIITTRFDYTDGTIIGSEDIPYIGVKQYDNYTIKYSAYNPKETPTTVSIFEGSTLLSSSNIAFVPTELTQRAMTNGTKNCMIKCGDTVYTYKTIVAKSDLTVTEPTDNLTLKLSARGRTNDDTNKTEWTYNGIKSVFSGFKWGGDGWIGNALRHTDNAHTTVKYQPLKQPQSNVNNAMAFVVKFRVSEVSDENAELIKCVDESGTGFVITSNEARMVTKGNSQLSMKMAAGTTYEVGFVSHPKAVSGSSDYEVTNSEMVYLFINGIMSGGVQRGTSDSIYQTTPQFIEMGAAGATLDVYLMRSYNTYLTDAQMLDCYIIDQDSADDLVELYEENNILDENGNISVDSVPDDMRYVIITGQQSNGVPTVMQAAVTNNKKAKYDVDEILCIKKSEPAVNFRLEGGCISLQGTSSLAYPIKNYRIYTYDSNKNAGRLYIGCNEQGIGGQLEESGKYSFKLANEARKQAAPVNCFCLKADFAESSSSHNTGMARLVQNVLTDAEELTPVQKHVDSNEYKYDVRTTVDGEPCLLFYRATKDDTPILLGKYNFNNDKSTEAVFGFLDIPGYHDQPWVTEKFEGSNPTQCWEFLNNDYPMGMFLDDDFESVTDGKPNWQKVFEGRFPDGCTDLTYLKPLVSWVKSTNRKESSISESDKTARANKFKTELGNYFDVDYLCDYYVLTEVFGCVDQRVKNMMMAFFYNPEKGRVLAYMIFYDCDTILGLRNDGRLKYSWDVNNNTIDTELSTAEKTVYAYAGHDSVLWNNLRELFPDKVEEAYKRLRSKMTNDTVFRMFDKEQSAKFCARIYNYDAMSKYVKPKTIGVGVNVDGSVTNVKYSYLEAMQGNRKSHRHWWLSNRFGLLDARYSSGQYTAIDISWKGNSASGAKVKATAKRDFYFEFRREGDTMIHSHVTGGEEWSYTYGQMANVGTIFHLLGGAWMDSLNLSEWGGFTDVNIPRLPILEKLVMGKVGTTYTLTELVIGNKLPMLKYLDIRNYTKLPSLDLSQCNRLQEVNASGCTALSTMTFAVGAPIDKLYLPNNYQTLTMRSLSKITRDNIVFGDKENLTGLWVENCEMLDGFGLFEELFALGGLKYVRLTDLELEGDGSDLKQWYEAGLKGIDSDGNTVGKCKLCGNYRLTTYLSDAEYERYVDYFDEMNIRQPQYTIIEFDETVSDDANISNLDNKTGYKFNKPYVPSAHISAILNARHRVLAKVTKKPTTRNVNMAGIDTTVNNLDGEMTYYPLHDDDSTKYVDGSEAKLDGTEGDWMMYEPFFWSKGINDYLNGKKYSCYSFSPADQKPDSPIATTITKSDLKKMDEGVTIGKKILVNKSDLASSYADDIDYSVCKITVRGYKKVRFPTVVGANLMGSIFTDDDGVIKQSVIVPSLGAKFEDGMYIISDIPDGATTLYFTISNTAEFDIVVLSNSNKIEDLEPEWVANDEHLCGVVGSTIVNSKLKACITGGSTSAITSWEDFHFYSVQRGMQQIDLLMHSRIANLAFAKYGRRNMQEQCGAGKNVGGRKTGDTSTFGMADTIGFEEAKKIKDDITNSLVDGMTHQYAWYKVKDNYGGDTVKQMDSICCLGYENIYGGKYDMMDGVDIPNTTPNIAKWRIWAPDGSTRYVKGSNATSIWVTSIANGKHMDAISVGNANGSSSSYFGDLHRINGTNRVVYRGGFSAVSECGISCVNATYPSSYASTTVGSRLAFRGKVIKAKSSTEYKGIKEFA